MAADRFINLSPAEVEAALAGGAVLIDVREPYEFEAARIAGALNYPLSSFDPTTLPQDAPLILSCARGARSVTAMQMCAAAGVAFDGHLAGGLHAWAMAGLPIER
jgi:rhodanese-related sulfurtransferase